MIYLCVYLFFVQALETKELQEFEKVSKPDFNYIPKRKDSHLRLPKLPNLVDSKYQTMCDIIHCYPWFVNFPFDLYTR